MPITLDDLAAYLEMQATPTGPAGAILQRMLDAAVQGVTKRTGLLDATSATARVTLGWEVMLLTPYRRLTSFGAVTDPYGVVTLPIRSDPFAGIIELPAPTLGTWSVVCTCTDPWPAELTSAALEWAGHLYQTQRMSQRSADDDTQPPSYAVPNRVAELIHPYRTPGIA